MVVNIKTIRISLNEKGLDKLINKLTLLEYGLKEADDKIVKEMADLVEKQVDVNLQQSIVGDGYEPTTPYSIVDGNKAEAGMRGSQSVYDEFGTGIIGKSQPHKKSPTEFNLRDYNTGPKINKVTNYWWYYKDGFKKTQGIPAGMQVYKASNELQKQKIKIIKKKVGEVISKL